MPENNDLNNFRVRIEYNSGSIDFLSGNRLYDLRIRLTKQLEFLEKDNGYQIHKVEITEECHACYGSGLTTKRTKGSIRVTPCKVCSGNKFLYSLDTPEVLNKAIFKYESIILDYSKTNQPYSSSSNFQHQILVKAWTPVSSQGYYILNTWTAKLSQVIYNNQDGTIRFEDQEGFSKGFIRKVNSYFNGLKKSNYPRLGNVWA